MTLEQLGNLGEFFGSIAVLITLIYLAMQVRFARMDSRAALLQHRNDSARDLWLCLASNERLARLMASGDERLGYMSNAAHRLMDEAKLTADEAVSAVGFACANFMHRQTAYLSDLTQDERRALDAQLVYLFSGGVYGLWFEGIAQLVAEGGDPTFDRQFVRHVASLRAAAQ